MTDALEQRIVPFYGDELVAVLHPDGTISVVFGRLCENLGLNRLGQVRRVQRHAVLEPGLRTVPVETAGGVQPLQCLKLTLLPLWLTGISVRRVKGELQDKLVRYQKEAADVLWQAFKPRFMAEETALTTVVDDAPIQQLQQIAEMGYAIARMAEQQIEIQRQQHALAGRMDTAARVLKDFHVRLSVLEDTIHPATYVTDAQATEISNAVKALAELLTGTDAAKNQYQGIFAELYRRFGVSSYKLIRQEQYRSVLQFLVDWRTASGA